MITSLSKKKKKERKKKKEQKEKKGKEKKEKGKKKEGNRKKEGKIWFLAHTGLAKHFWGKIIFSSSTPLTLGEKRKIGKWGRGKTMVLKTNIHP